MITAPSTLIGTFELTASAELAALGLSKPRTLELRAGRISAPTEKYPGRWYACYEVIERLTGSDTPRAHQLRQHNSVMYHDGTAPEARQATDMLRPEQMPCLRQRPRWKRTDTAWPFSAATHTPFHFAAHYYLSETAQTTRSAAPGIPANTLLCLFLHAAPGDQLQILIFSQDISAQTAGEHYALEADIAEYETALRTPARVEPLVRRGGKEFHAYLLTHPKTTPATLALLAAHGKTKQLRAAATKRLESGKTSR